MDNNSTDLVVPDKPDPLPQRCTAADRSLYLTRVCQGIQGAPEPSSGPCLLQVILHILSLLRIPAPLVMIQLQSFPESDQAAPVKMSDDQL